MDAREIFKQVKKNNHMDINFGYVFVEDVRDEAEREKLFRDKQNQINTFNHLELFSNFYFPFDRVTFLSINTFAEDRGDSFFSVTFADNPEHKVSSPINFTINSPHQHTVASGVARIEPVDDAKRSVGSVALSNEYPDDIIYSQGVSCFDADGNELENNKWAVTLHFKKMYVKVKSKVVKCDHIRELVRSDKDYSDMMELLRFLSSKVIFSLIYFSSFLASTDCFVVEERVTSVKKGRVRSNPASALFRIVDIKTLRAKYIKRDFDDNGNVKVGHERRRHTRTFRSDFYKNKKGETIIIEATWVGPTEHFDGPFNRFYKVRLDIG